MRYKYIILGAGCAGLSLCWYLFEQGVRDPILILDRKSRFGDDRTWCFWDTEPTPFTHLATHRWPAWTVRGGGDAAAAGATTEVRASAPETPYVRLQGRDFYGAVLERIQASGNVTLRLGVAVTGGYRDHGPEGVCVRAGSETFHGETLFDALALGSPRFPVARRDDTTFFQQFFGQFIRTAEDTFDPQTVTLMDFANAPPAGGTASGAIRFTYVLPLSTREALVENTVLVPGGSGAKDALAQAGSAAANRAEIAAYLGARYGLHSFEVASEEQGLIPMTTRAFPLRTGEHTFSIGLAGGAARPSSGYAFLRIQRRCRALAQAVVCGGDLSRLEPGSSSWRTATLDRIFLRALLQNPDAVPGYFARLFARVPPGALVRALSDSASLLDCFAMIRALPPRDFVCAAFDLERRGASR